MTAAYMTRCVYLTFFGEYRGARRTPHESRADSITGAAHRRSPMLLASLAGPRSTPRRFGIEKFKDWFEPDLRVPATLVHPELRLSERRRISVLDRGARHRRSPAYFWFQTRRARAAARASPSATRSRDAGNTFLVNKYYLDDLYEDVIVAGIKGPIAARRVLGQPARDRQRRERTSVRGARGARALHLRLHRPEGGRRRRQRRWPTVTGDAGGAAALRPDPAGVQRYALLLVRGRRALRPRALRSSRLAEGNRLDELVRRLGADPGGLHPRRRRGDRAAHPDGRRKSAIKVVALLTTLATLGVGIGDPRRLRLRPAGALQFSVNKPWIDVINSRYHIGIDGISLPLLVAVDVHHGAVRHLLVEPLPRAAQPEGVPRARSSSSRSGMNGTFVAAGPHPLLHLLRDRAAPDVLHDRRVGRPEPRVRVDQVLPVHAVRLGADAAELPGAVLPVEASHTFDMVAARARCTAPASCTSTQLLIFARAVPRLRDQGADVPVPHVAARRAHRGADRRLGAAGRDPAEARHVRLHPHRAPDPARSGAERGRRGSGCSR